MYTKDVIIVLDATRFDYGEPIFKQLLVGAVKKVDTGCSTTAQWYLKHWGDKTNRVLVSENPMPWHATTKHAHRNFIAAHMVSGRTWMDIDPRKTMDKFKSIYKPDEKYLIHLLPPHLPLPYPPAAKELMDTLRKQGKNIYRQAQSWGQTHGFERFVDYYKEAIEATLEIVIEYLDFFADRTVVVTADHGELIGEANYYDHISDPNDELKPYLHEVPYVEVDINETILNSRLKMLGYLD